MRANMPILRNRASVLLVCTSDRPERVGDVLLRQRKQERVLDDEPQRLGALVEHDDQRRGALRRGAPAGAGQILVDVALLARAEPGDVESEPRHLAEQRPDFAARQQAELHFGQRLDAVLRGVEHGGLQADEIAGQEEIQDLAAAVGQHFEAKRPAGIQRVDFRAVLAGANDLGARRQREWSRLISLMAPSSLGVMGLNKPQARNAHSKQLTCMMKMPQS